MSPSPVGGNGVTASANRSLDTPPDGRQSEMGRAGRRLIFVAVTHTLDNP